MHYFLIFLCLIASASASDLVLLRDRVAEAVIIPAQTPVARYAAKELQYHLEKIGGTKLLIEEKAGEGAAVIISSFADDATLPSLLGVDASTFGDEEVLVKRVGNRLYLTGKTPSASLYATYTFLQETLGCRWFWPGASGEYLPAMETVAIGALDLRERPSLARRSYSINHPHNDETTDIWLARQRLNVRILQSRFPKGMPEKLHSMGFSVGIGGHNAVLPDAILKAHPEYGAEIAGVRSVAKLGRRPAHLCWANKGVQKAMVEQIAEWLSANPEVSFISLCPTDQTLFCECSECRAMAVDISTRWQIFGKALEEPLKNQFPDRELWMLAYQDYRNLPKGGAAPWGNVSYCAYNANYIAPFDTSEAANAPVKKELLEWQAKGVPVSLRGYEFIPFIEPMWTPISRLIVSEIAWLSAKGMHGFYSEVTPYGFPKDQPDEQRGWTVNRLALYAGAQAMWKSSLTSDAIIEDWHQHLYGPASGPMLAYYRLLEDAWYKVERPLSYFLHPPSSFVTSFLSPALALEAKEQLEQARKQAGQEASGRSAEQVELERKMFERWNTVLLLQQNKKDQLTAEVLHLAEPPSEESWSGAPSLSAFMDRKGNRPADGTDVKLLWSDDALLLRVVCHDARMDALVARKEEHDGKVFSDDCIELFLEWQPGSYAHLAFNSNGVRYDALASGGMNFDEAWNPTWEVETSKGEESWTATVRIPFASMSNKAPKDGDAWRMAVKRSRPGSRRNAQPELVNSGWPDAAYHNANALGEIIFTHELSKPTKVVLYHAGRPERGVMVELLKNGAEVVSIDDGESALVEALEQKPEAVLFPYTGKPIGLSDAFFHATLQPYVEAGGVVLISASGKLPLGIWFSDPALELVWSGWEVNKLRRTVGLAPGLWKETPHRLVEAFKNRIAPASAYRPVHAERWEALASVTLRDGSQCPYLLKAKLGSGTLYVTSSNMGYSGGGEIFGRRRPGNAAMLVDNLIRLAHSSPASLDSNASKASQ